MRFDCSDNFYHLFYRFQWIMKQNIDLVGGSNILNDFNVTGIKLITLSWGIKDLNIIWLVNYSCLQCSLSNSNSQFSSKKGVDQTGLPTWYLANDELYTDTELVFLKFNKFQLFYFENVNICCLRFVLLEFIRIFVLIAQSLSLLYLFMIVLNYL